MTLLEVPGLKQVTQRRNVRAVFDHHLNLFLAVAASTISQIALGLEVQPAANEKRRLGAVHQMGDTVARKIEVAFGMPAGAMDRPAEWREPTDLTAAQRNMLTTLEAMMRSGCMTDAECYEELDRLRRTYPESAEGFSVHVLMVGDQAISLAGQ